MLKLIQFIISLLSKKEASVKIEEAPLIKKEEVKVPTKVKHVNNGDCPKCEEIFNRYPRFHIGLKSWFKTLQSKSKDAHIACAGRGKKEQEEYFTRGSSKAHYSESSHNFNLAIDIFALSINGADWSKTWFSAIIAPAVDLHNNDPKKTFEIEWYGRPGSKFYELPHCEVKNWRSIEDKKLVE